MKGLQGLLIAAGLGVAGAILNWFYIQKQAREYESVAFVAVRADAGVNLGDRFKGGQLERVDVPKRRVGNLERTAVQWNARGNVIGMYATRSYGEFGDEILLNQDLKTPAHKDLNSLISESERVIWLPVDSRTFNPLHVNPGDEVSFMVSLYAAQSRVPTTSSSVSRTGTGTGSARSEIVGPFRILALGNRKGRVEVRRAAGLSSGGESTIAIAVELEKSGQLGADAERISEVLQLTNFQGVQVLLHPAPSKK